MLVSLSLAGALFQTCRESGSGETLVSLMIRSGAKDFLYKASSAFLLDRKVFLGGLIPGSGNPSGTGNSSVLLETN